MTKSAFKFPVFIVIPDEGTIRRNADEHELAWFEQIDIEDMRHVGWDFEAKPIELIWEPGQRSVSVVVTGPQDLDGFVKAANTYLNWARGRGDRVGGHICKARQLELDLQHMRQLPPST